MYDAVVLGAGVIGLSIATELTNRGYKVAIIGKDLPEDSNSAGFASPWAGCNWHSFEIDPESPAARWDVRTYKRLSKLAKDYPHLCERMSFVDVFSRHTPAESSPFHKVVDDFKLIKASSQSPLPGDFPHGHSYISFVTNAPNYILHLATRLREAGVPIIRKRISSLDEAYDIPEIGSVDLVVNATGLGARSLIGVEDGAVHPARGQTVLVKAPSVKRCIMSAESFMSDDPASQGKSRPTSYIIPRPGSGGLVVLGGTYLRDNYSTLPDLSEAKRILQDCYDLEPKLAEGGKSWEDIEVVAHNVGLRPARAGGPRLEIQEREIGTYNPLIPGKSVRKRRATVLHAYGLGSAGFQASLGMAEEAAELVTRRFKPKARL